MIMYEAFEPTSDGRVWRFRKLDALARRIGGGSARWRVEHTTSLTPEPRRTVHILVDNDVVARLRVPSEAVG